MKQKSMLRQCIGVLSVLMLLANLPTQVRAKPTEGFTATQKAEIEAIVRQYLVDKNPETINEAMKVVNQREQARKETAAKEALSRNKSLIFGDSSSPVLGNPKGDVTIVEFYDYSCGYCKASHAAVAELLKTDKNVRLIAKEFPILGEGSMLAARAALASVKQNKFDKFHAALMEYREQFDEAAIMNLARQAGLDPARLKRDMNDKAIDQAIAKNQQLGNELGITGTPMFIIGDTVNPGGLDAAALKQAVANARSASKKVGLSRSK
jgi:protein-disulfide isomerase